MAGGASEPPDCPSWAPPPFEDEPEFVVPELVPELPPVAVFDECPGSARLTYRAMANAAPTATTEMPRASRLCSLV